MFPWSQLWHQWWGCYKSPSVKLLFLFSDGQLVIYGLLSHTVHDPASNNREITGFTISNWAETVAVNQCGSLEVILIINICIISSSLQFFLRHMDTNALQHILLTLGKESNKVIYAHTLAGHFIRNIYQIYVPLFNGLDSTRCSVTQTFIRSFTQKTRDIFLLPAIV